MGSTDSSTNQLGITLKTLLERWEEAKVQWNDPVSQHFEKQYLTPIQEHTHTTLKEMQCLAQTVAEARHEVR